MPSVALYRVACTFPCGFDSFRAHHLTLLVVASSSNSPNPAEIAFLGPKLCPLTYNCRFTAPAAREWCVASFTLSET